MAQPARAVGLWAIATLLGVGCDRGASSVVGPGDVISSPPCDDVACFDDARDVFAENRDASTGVQDAVDARGVDDAPADAAADARVLRRCPTEPLDGGARRVQRSCADPAPPGCGLVEFEGVREGFTVGGDDAGYSSTPAQGPVALAPFAVDQYEVSVGRFRRFMDQGNCAPAGDVAYPGGRALPWVGTLNTDDELRRFYGAPGIEPECSWTVPFGDGLAMNCVSWATAQAFCAWDGGRLPTQAEWELVARGVEGRSFPWGESFGRMPPICWSGSGTAPHACLVGSIAAGVTPRGVFDMAGNVWEWNADYFEEYRDDGVGCWGGGPQSNPLCDRPSLERVIRGGSWNSVAGVAYFRAASRAMAVGDLRDVTIGFRCVYSR